MKPVIVREAAISDIEDAFNWYETQRPGLGNEFRSALRTTFDHISANAELFQVVHRNTRRALLRRFPYGVFYRAFPEVIVVVAVMHGRRSPARWQSRT